MKRVLVVDDSALIRAVARFALEEAGDFAVETAESGAEGLERAAAEGADVILLDVVMPDLDGPAVLAALRERPQTADIPVILMTGSEDVRASFRELGAAGAIAKPFEAAELPAAVRAILGWDS